MVGRFYPAHCTYSLQSMYYFRFFCIAVTLLALSGCARNVSEPEGSGDAGIETGTLPEPSPGALPGRVFVKFKKEQDKESLDAYAHIGHFRRMYPDAGIYEARHREAGLHLWYVVTFDESVPLTKAGMQVSELQDVDILEYDLPVKFHQSTVFPFNDPGLSRQWHYHNDGSIQGTIAGSDIRLLDAWLLETGKPDVIVAVHDGGIQYNHPDLEGNMWMNRAEAEGAPGVDDDENGYVDDIYGYCFYSETVGGAIHPDNHGTHIAGTIAACNNNESGGAGIAGGNGTPDSGVRLMSVCTSGGDDTKGAYLQQGFVYAADNGAVLINCSWSIPEATSTPLFLKEAIDYFNRYAGLDDKGNQRGPMAGGVAFFAAGNENRDNKEYPAMDDNVVAVASIGANYHKAYYSSYGEWVDIAAPGGDVQQGHQVYSTITGGNYGNMQGTSMACPHVTGVAALAVSYFGGPGFTREQLIRLLTETTNPVIEEYNTSYAGQLGSGLVDASACLGVTLDAPASVQSLSGKSRSNYIDLEWIVPGASRADIPYSYDVYYSLSPLNDVAGNDVRKISVPGGKHAAGESMAVTLSNLELNKDYHIRILSRSMLDKVSAPSPEIVINTLDNKPPVVEALDGTSITLKAFQSGALRFKVSDPDGHPLTCSLEGATAGISHTFADGIVTVSFDALSLEDGKSYQLLLRVSDSHDSVDTPIGCQILKNHAPVAVKEMDNQVIQGIGESLTLDLSGYFSDEDAEPLTYSARNLGTQTVAACTIEGDQLHLKGSSYGNSSLEITAMDARKNKALLTFLILVRDGSREVEIYPNPVESTLYLRTGSGQNASLVLSNKSGAVLFRESSAAMGPFAPYAIDMRDYTAGSYYLKVNGVVYTVIKK